MASPSNQDDYSCTKKNRWNLNSPPRFCFSISDEEYLALCLLNISLGNGDPNSTQGKHSLPADTVPPTLTLPVLDPSYKCSVGGHKSIHRNSVPSVSDQTLIPCENSCITNDNSRGRKYDCSICHKSFKTGKDLGGHMRCHKKESRGGGWSSGLASSESSVGTEATKNQSHRGGYKFEFDLNLPDSPELGLGVEESEKKKMEEEEEEEEVESHVPAKKPRLFK